MKHGSPGTNFPDAIFARYRSQIEFSPNVNVPIIRGDSAFEKHRKTDYARPLVMPVPESWSHVRAISH